MPGYLGTHTHPLATSVSQCASAGYRAQGTLFLESGLSESDLIVEDGLQELSQSCHSGLTVTNSSDHTCRVRRGTVMGSTCQATVEVIPGDRYQASATRRVYTEEVGTRRQLLADLLKGQDMALDNTQRQLLASALTDLHGAFCLQEGDWGETVVQYHIVTK